MSSRYRLMAVMSALMSFYFTYCNKFVLTYVRYSHSHIVLLPVVDKTVRGWQGGRLVVVDR